MNSDIFRFVSVRPPQMSNRATASVDFVYTHPALDGATTLLSALRAAREERDARQRMTQVARDFVRSAEFLAEDDRDGVPLARLDRLLAGRADDANVLVLNDEVRSAFKRSAQGAVTEQDFGRTRRRASDSLLAVSIDQEAALHRPRLVRWLRLLGIIERIAMSDEALSRPAGLLTALRAVVLLPASVFPVPRAESGAGSTPGREGAVAAGGGDRRETISRSTVENDARELARLKTAHDEVVSALRGLRQEAIEGIGRNPRQARSDAAVGGSRTRVKGVSVDPDLADTAQLALVLSEGVLARLSAGTRELLERLGTPAARTPLPEMVERVTDEIGAAGSRIHAAGRQITTIRIGGTYLPADELPADELQDPGRSP